MKSFFCNHKKRLFEHRLNRHECEKSTRIGTLDAVSDGLPPRSGGPALFRLFPASLNRYISLDMLLIRSLVKAIITASKCSTYYITVPKGFSKI